MPADASGAPVRADGSVSVGSRAARSGWTYLELLLVQLHLPQLVPDGLRPPAPVVPLQEAQLQAAEALLQILQRVTKLKDQQSELISTSACANKHFSAPKSLKSEGRPPAASSVCNLQNKSIKGCLFPRFIIVPASVGRIFSISFTANVGLRDGVPLTDANGVFGVLQQFSS